MTKLQPSPFKAADTEAIAAFVRTKLTLDTSNDPSGLRTHHNAVVRQVAHFIAAMSDPYAFDAMKRSGTWLQ